MRPAVGSSRPPRRFSSVDLPLPDGPLMATNSPRRISRSSARSALTLPSGYSRSSLSQRMSGPEWGVPLDGGLLALRLPGLSRDDGILLDADGYGVRPAHLPVGEQGLGHLDRDDLPGQPDPREGHDRPVRQIDL